MFLPSCRILSSMGFDAIASPGATMLSIASVLLSFCSFSSILIRHSRSIFFIDSSRSPLSFSISRSMLVPPFIRSTILFFSSAVSLPLETKKRSSLSSMA